MTASRQTRACKVYMTETQTETGFRWGITKVIDKHTGRELDQRCLYEVDMVKSTIIGLPIKEHWAKTLMDTLPKTKQLI